mgnify:CR=1 FL=1
MVLASLGVVAVTAVAVGGVGAVDSAAAAGAPAEDGVAPADRFEPNDRLTTAAAVTEGTYDLRLEAGESDYFRVSLDAEDALDFYEAFFSTGVLDDYRETMAGKLGTSECLDLTRMAAAMGEFNTAKLLVDAGYDVVPEIEVTTGHSIDFQARTAAGEQPLVEVTRPLPPNRRSAGTPAAAVRDTAKTKTNGQLSEHAGGVVLFVDCSSFPDDDWLAVAGAQPDVGHRPALVYRVRPDGRVDGYTKGSVPLELSSVLN